MPAHLLQFEITESTVMQHIDRVITLLNALQRRGVRLAIDDFGTGYSSMSLMKRFPIDTIKIDRSFIHDLVENEQDQAIARAIIGMRTTSCANMPATSSRAICSANLCRPARFHDR